MELIVIFALILVNFFFALSEAAFISSHKAVIQDAQRKGLRRAGIILDYMKTPEKFLSAVQVGITLIGIVSGAFGGLTLADDLARFLVTVPVIAPAARQLAVVLTVGLITYVTIVAGELFPKSVALRNPEKIILAVIPVMNVITRLFYPAVLFLSFSTRLLLRVFRVKRGGGEDNPIKEIVALARAAVRSKRISKDQETILYNTINIGKIRLQEIMIDRAQVKFLLTDMTLTEAMLEAHIHHHTRYPLLDGRTDSVVGYINLKDIYSALQINPQYDSISSISREILEFRESDKVVEVLPRMMKQFQHIAVVRGSSGTVTGLVTLEDLIESIIGDIYDEYELLPEHIITVTENRHLVGGGVRLKKLRERLSLDLPDTEEKVADWLAARAGADIAAETRIVCGGYEFIVRKVKKGKINEVILQR